MLYRVREEEVLAVLDAASEMPIPVRHTYKHWSHPKHPDVTRPAVLADDTSDPSIIILCEHDLLTGWVSDDALWASVMHALIAREGEFPDGFPGKGVWRNADSDEKSAGNGRPYIFFIQLPSLGFKAALDAGFTCPAEDYSIEPAAELWYIEGEPRFSELVKHSCRTVEGLELYDLLKESWPYGDEESAYVRLCLLEGPSFVCEVDGEPVCWGATHLSRTMAMLHTPEELRGRGYASSLAAFQTDEMLERDGIAAAHIWHDNIPSSSLMKKLGARKLPGYFGWWIVHLPKE